VGRLNISERLVDPRSPERRPRKAAYALPALFTAGNLFLGYLSIMKSFQGAMAVKAGDFGPNANFDLAALAIGVAVLLDGLDGRIARLTNTVSDFGRELDSLADIISFGVAPAVLAFAWGVAFVDGNLGGAYREQLQQAGYFLAFLFLLCGAMRLARFNVQVDPIPKNPGRPGRKYFVGVPIPAAAGMVAAAVYATGSEPIVWWVYSVAWLGLMALLSFLMVSTWRYRSFKNLSLVRPRSPRSVVLFGIVIFLIWNYSRPVLISIALLYIGSGIVIRLGGIARRLVRPSRSEPEEQASPHA
jgi:CDP-diacylglycerol--serine O-phosphatidyltransferase